MPPARHPHLRAGLGILQDSGDRAAQFRRLSRWDEQPGLLVHDDFLDAPDPGGHDRRLAGHRLEVDDPERLVDGRTGEHGRFVVQIHEVVVFEHVSNPDHIVPGLDGRPKKKTYGLRIENFSTLSRPSRGQYFCGSTPLWITATLDAGIGYAFWMSAFMSRETAITSSQARSPSLSIHRLSS